MGDGERYLDEVGRGLSLGHYEAGQLLDELRRHIEDTSDALVDAGVGRREAVGVAVGRLGPPRDRARDLMRAQHARRWTRSRPISRIRPLVVVGALAIGALGSVLWGFNAAAA